MKITRSIDLEDTDGLLAADREGLLRAASSAGAQVRAIAAAQDEGALDSLRVEERARSVIWVAGRGTAETAGAILAATLGGVASEPMVIGAEAPPWVGPLDVLIVAGDDPGDPALVGAAATGVRRGARVVVVAPYEGPLRDTTAGRAAVLAPRLWVPDEFALCRYLAAGLVAMQAVDPKLGLKPSTELASLADELDAEALRNSAGREVFTNPAKTMAARISGRRVALTGDCAATLALARHGSSALLRIARQVAAATGLADAVFHDDEIDGPLPERLRVLALTLTEERAAVAARVGGFDDIYLVAPQDVPDVPDSIGDPVESGGLRALAGPGRAEQQLAVLAVRMEMAAVYLRLVRG